MQTLVTMALKVESAGLFESSGIQIFYSGVGSVPSTYNLTKWILEHKPKRVLNLGTAGSHQYKIGELVECTSFVQRKANNLIPYTTETITTKALTDLKSVICGSGDFIETNHPITVCDIFDMEAYALAFVCKKMNVPFHSIKYITDQSNDATMTDWKSNLKTSAEALINQFKKIQTI